MKKLPYLLLFFFPLVSYAAGTFQLVNFIPLPAAISSAPYQATINFIYSGDNTPHVSLLGTQLPTGLSLSKVYLGTNGLDYVKIVGTPEVAGAYRLTLLLTDNYGAVLTKDIDFVVNDWNSDINTSLPTGTVNQSYSGEIQIPYLGTRPSLYYSGLPSGLFISQDDMPESNGAAVQKGTLILTVFGTPTKVGNFPISFVIAYSNSNEKTVKNFSINIENVIKAEQVQLPKLQKINQEDNKINKQTNKFLEKKDRNIITVVRPTTTPYSNNVSLNQEPNGEEKIIAPYKVSFMQRSRSVLRNFLLSLVNKIN